MIIKKFDFMFQLSYLIKNFTFYHQVICLHNKIQVLFKNVIFYIIYMFLNITL